MSAVKRLFSVAALAAATTLAACSDSTGPKAFDPAAFNTQLGTVASSFDGNAAFQSMATLSSLFPSFSATHLLRAGMPAAPRAAQGATPMQVLAAVRAQLAAMPRSPSGADALFPVDVLGKTYAWSTGLGAYAIDTSLHGAPLTGLRIRLYTVNQNTGQPVVPLQLLGYVELTDKSTAAANTLGVLLKLGATTVADYTISVVNGLTAQDLDILGYITAGDGSGRADFNFSSHDDDPTSDMVWLLSTATTSLHYEFHGNSSAETGSLLFLISSNGNSLEFSGTETAGAFSGQMKFNGTQFATVTATAGGDPVFTGTNGHTFTAQEQAELNAVFGLGLLTMFVILLGLTGPIVISAVLAG